ncbi:MAG: right-handed parallel beta-helix repeat-containing protein [Cyclobacteriaceae bacterium]|nr:right-handed parallel beta-helix repeat-containing protein [Cyclobacteriaceae bacterium]
MLKKLLGGVFALLMFDAAPGFAQNCIPTFNSIGIYWSPGSGSATNECQVQYRVNGTQEWHQGLPLWYDDRNNQYRGSIVNLHPGTLYEVQLNLKASSEKETYSVSTWSEDFPIAKTVYLPSNSAETYTIDQSGSSEGYVLYTHRPGAQATIDVKGSRDYGINIAPNTSYVIIRGLTIIGPKVHGINIGGNSHDVVIEQNDISNWGSANQEGWAINYHAAIYAKSKSIKRIIIQRNKLHHPRADANSWGELRQDRNTYHPGGAHGVCFVDTEGNHVIRYNDIYSDEEHYFCDGLGGSTDYSFEGFPNKDSDIYGNSISHCWDDGIESEGGNQNVRIWGNHIDKTFVKIAIASTSKGPLYIYRNVAGSSRRNATETDSDVYGRGPFIKAGGKTRKQNIFFGGGRTYIFHNTIMQPEASGKKYTLGGASAIQSSGGKLFNAVSRNNIFLTYKPTGSIIIDNTGSCDNDFNYDLFNGKVKQQCADRPHQQQGIRLSPNEMPQFGDSYFLQTGSRGINQATAIPNFNQHYSGKGPDMGAFEQGMAPLEFGTKAYLKN